MKVTVETFAKAKTSGSKLSMLTAYDYTFARLVDESGIDAILVGDSLGMVMLGYEDTLQVTMADMIHHSRAVARGAKRAMIVTDLPFMSYHVSVAQAVENAGRLVQEGRAQTVKMEGGTAIAPHIQAITAAGIPVMGHIGLTPQSVNAFGGFKVQGKSIEAAQKLIDDAKAVEEAGAFAVVLECIPEKVAQRITESLTIPTIGIGGGRHCDGQILVYHDMLSLYGDFTPKFVKRYTNSGEAIKQAFAAYNTEVKSGAFPGQEHTFAIADDVLSKLY